MIEQSLESHRRWSIPNTLIKLHEFVDFSCHRLVMHARSCWLRAYRRDVLKGKPRSILVLRLGSLGDVVRSTSLLTVLAERYPESDIQYLTSPAGRKLPDDHLALFTVHTLDSLEELPVFDWTINLHRPEPADDFLHSKFASYDVVLSAVSKHVVFISGRHRAAGRFISARPTNFYCHSDLEEFFSLALLSYRHEFVERASNAMTRTQNTLDELGILRTSRHIGIFVGAVSSGGHDGGFRAYSVDYLESLITALRETFEDHYTIVLYGQSSLKSKAEGQSSSITERHCSVLNLTDRTDIRKGGVGTHFSSVGSVSLAGLRLAC